MDQCFSLLPKEYQSYSPKLFTYPFYPEVDEIMLKIKQEFSEILENKGFLSYSNYDIQGKMYGFLIVQKPSGEKGYLKAYSGEILDHPIKDEFVAPVFDKNNFEKLLKDKQSKVNTLNDQIDTLKSNPKLKNLTQTYHETYHRLHQKLNDIKSEHKKNKAKRKTLRKEFPNDQDLLNRLAYESSQEKLSRKNKVFENERILSDLQNAINTEEEKIKILKSKRLKILQDLQNEKEKFTIFLNGIGESKDLNTVFKNEKRNPPPGTGECCAPKLLQHAYKLNYKPLALLEFWWGPPHKSLIRKHGQNYPACTHRCGPVLDFMLKGLDVAPNPMKKNYGENKKLSIIYEDSSLIIVDKPHGLLSVPGKYIKDSVLTRLENLYPESKGNLLIHRLDQDTSGVMIFTKNKSDQKFIQKQFINRTLKKSYLAVLEYGKIENLEGKINLPLITDEMNPPFQKVCFQSGKSATTHYKVVEIRKDCIMIQFWPITGRTHQLRVHSAHPSGLGLPILGDDMYGQKSNRLHLHAHTIEFMHPTQKKVLKFSSLPKFM